MNDRKLCLDRRKAARLLVDVANGLPRYGGRDIDVEFDTARLVGNAVTDNFTQPVSTMSIGVAGLSGRYDFGFLPVTDRQFTKAIVSLFHEYGHYLQNYGTMQSVETAVSEASVVKNVLYYKSNWNVLPHEIMAESAGVLLAWDAMTAMFPGRADDAMLDYVNARAADTMYMIPVKDGGYQSRCDVENAFSEAMDRSLNNPRKPDSSLQRPENEISAFLKQGCANYKLSPNGRHFGMLLERMPGRRKDRMIAVVSIHLHPEILQDHPILGDEFLTVEHEFGIPLGIDTLPGAGPNMKVLQDAMHIGSRVHASGDGREIE